jgi:hypothetical protein
MSKKTLLTVGTALLLLLLVNLSLPAKAAPPFQLTPFPTPTPGPDGRILYTVQTGDTLWRIAAVAEMDLDELRRLNNLNPEDVIFDGQVLLLGLGGPSEQQPSPPPETTPEPQTLGPTPTFGPGTGMVCVFLFDDLNGDAMRQESEISIPGGAVSVSERAGAFSQTGNTTESIDPICFEDLPGGEYNISVAIPDGYNPTTLLNKTLEVNPGDTVIQNFGAQLGTAGQIDSPPPEEGGRSPLLGVLGIGLLLIGIGLGIFSTRMSRRKTTPPGASSSQPG